MSKSMYSHEQIIQAGQFTPEDTKEILQRRHDHNRLGFAYQMAFVRLVNRFPAQQPLEVLPELLTYVGLQLVNAISSLDVTRDWGEGKTSRSDGQRFRYKQKVL